MGKFTKRQGKVISFFEKDYSKKDNSFKSVRKDGASVGVDVSASSFSKKIEKTENFTLEYGKEQALYQVKSDTVNLRVTCPSNDTAPIKLLSVYNLQQTGSMTFEFVAAVGVTVLGNAHSWEQYGFYSAIKTGMNEWTIVGGSAT